MGNNDRILNGKDLARRDGVKTQCEWIVRLCKRMGAQLETPFTGVVVDDAPVEAEINFGRWVARCECGGAEYVDPEEQVFYCFSCGNASTQGAGRRVIFPEELEAIEAAVLERGVEQAKRGPNALARAVLARPATEGLGRNWKPGQTAKELRAEAKKVKGKGE